ncbi:MAG: DUF3800 domain-containing protein [Candidatus Izimaplasma sp.]|nr:DUF3800 domain-containing protein [Candidatus Izimaplasma bacterium]
MQKVEIYCDESRPDLLTSQDKYDKYLLIGGLKLLAEHREEIKNSIKDINQRYKINTEIKWNKVSFSRVSYYKELIDLFLSFGDSLRFRCIAIEADKIDLKHFHNNDAELGFYKFYYQLLHHWIVDNNEYVIFTDLKTSRIKNRLSNLRIYLNNSNLFSYIKSIQALPSRQVTLIQLTDLLLGLSGARLNNSIKEKSAKFELLHYFESKLGRKISPTTKDEIKFNVFTILLQNRW